jgi:hypothetical protein
MLAASLLAVCVALIVPDLTACRGLARMIGSARCFTHTSSSAGDVGLMTKITRLAGLILFETCQTEDAHASL